MKLGVLVSGGGTNLQAIIDKIEAGELKNVSIEVVISNNKGVFALERAKKHGIAAECICPSDFENRSIYYSELIKRLKDYGVELVVLAGFLVNISPEMVAAFPKRIINIHPSLIPSFCGKGFYGLKVHECALARGVKVTGATVHFVDEGTDSGPIILQKAVEIPAGISAKDLQLKVMQEAEWILLPRAIQMIADGEV